MNDSDQPKGLVAKVADFRKQSERVLNVTHKPQGDEYKHMAVSTAIGMVVVGIIGFVITTIAIILRG